MACHRGRVTRQEKKEKTFPPLTKRGAFRLPQKVVINVFSLGNPTPLANEGGIYHLHCGGRCREDSNPSAWEQFTFFSLIVPENCDRFGRGKKHLRRQLLWASTATHDDHFFKTQNNPPIRDSHLPCTGNRNIRITVSQGGYVFVCVCLSVGYLAGLHKKILHGLPCNLVQGCSISQEITC